MNSQSGGNIRYNSQVSDEEPGLERDTGPLALPR